jgi:predicted DNA-binding transcriptional regulator AlpA
MTTEKDDTFLPARKVWERYGVSDMSLFRWERDERMNFPKPIRIGRYKYWKLSDLEQWERSLPRGVASKTEEAA